VDDKGMVWYAGNRRAHIGVLDPATGRIRKYDMPDSTPRDPHTLIFDGKGNIWFTAQGGQHVGRLNMSSGKVDRIPTGERTNPYGIKLDSKGNVWVALLAAGKILNVNAATMATKEFTMPKERAGARRLVITSDDMVWYGDFRNGNIGRLDPRSGKIDEWPLPGGQNAAPYGMAVDDRDRVWLSITNDVPGRLVAFDTKKFEISHVAVLKSQQQNGKNTIRHMVFHKPTRTIWYGTDAGTIGRLQVP
jgi:virginiamycin B lyase